MICGDFSAAAPLQNLLDLMNQHAQRSKGGKINPLSRWKFRFSGKEDLFSFLDKVEESADVHGVDDRTLLTGIPLLLEGDAHRWFSAKKKTITKWTLFKTEIKAAFDPAEDDEGMMAKLNNMRQKPDETFVVYESRFEEICKRLSCPLNDKEKLRKIIKGLHLFYRNRVTATEIEDLRTLRRKCKAWELDKQQVLKLEKEDRRRREKEKEEKKRSGRVAAVKVESASSSSEEEEPAVETVHTLDAAAKKLGLVCWRCKIPGHIAFKCPNKVFCENCGLKDTLADRCPRCAQAYQAGYWGRPSSKETPAQGNASTDQKEGALGPFTEPPPPLGQPQNTSTPRATPSVLQRPKGPGKN